MSLIYNGWDKKEWPPEYDNAKLEAGGHIITRKDIKNYLDDEFYQCLLFWQRVKTFGFPKPWTETAYVNLQVVELFDAALAELKKEDADAADRRAKSSSSRRG